MVISVWAAPDKERHVLEMIKVRAPSRPVPAGGGPARSDDGSHAARARPSRPGPDRIADPRAARRTGRLGWCRCARPAGGHDPLRTRPHRGTRRIRGLPRPGRRRRISNGPGVTGPQAGDAHTHTGFIITGSKGGPPASALVAYRAPGRGCTHRVAQLSWAGFGHLRASSPQVSCRAQFRGLR